jgi:retron-type reverse transcriptase
MKRIGRLLEPILERDNLRLAFYRAARGKRATPEVIAFSADLDRTLTGMADEVRAGTFVVGRYRQFVIQDPKERIITAPCFAERVLHHALVAVCEPYFERWQLFDSYACRVGKGRDAAVRRAVHFASGHGWFLKFDVRKYFDSIDHERLLAQLERRFKDRQLLDLLRLIVRGFRGELGRGLPIGSLVSQYLANFYLTPVDRLVKERLGIPGYVRYMDDVALWSNDADQLRAARSACEEALHDLGLSFKPVPYQNRTAHGMDFLGSRVLPHRAVLNRPSRVRFRRKLRQFAVVFAAGGLSDAELQQRVTALVAFTRAAGIRSWTFRRHLLSSASVAGPEARTA